jgi:hypothetical protein
MAKRCASAYRLPILARIKTGSMPFALGFFRLITRYQQEIEEDFGKLRFQIAVKSGPQRGEMPRYVLLTEDQTYAYMSYSQNTPQARQCKRLLVKAFAEARNHLAELTRPSESPNQALIDALIERLLLNVPQILDGHFAVGGGLLRNMALLSKKLERSTLDALAKLDQSIGQHFLNDCCKEELQAHHKPYTHLYLG